MVTHDIRGGTGSKFIFLQLGNKEGLLKIQKRSFFTTIVNMITGASYTLCSSRFQILACLSSHSDRSSGRLQWHKLVNTVIASNDFRFFFNVTRSGLH